MKNFFKILLAGLIVVISVSVFATKRTFDKGEVIQGKYYTLGGGTADTIVVSDTVEYIMFVNRTNIVYPELDLLWTKIGAGTATLKVEFFESKDGVTSSYTACKKGKAQGAYTKTLTLTATGYTPISFRADTALFTGRYLKTKYSTTSTATVKGKITNLWKLDIW
jgi:hypothetical protein